MSRIRPRAIAGATTRLPWLPPLNALRAFEAAGRHRSFKNAAVELYVTPSAISRQIKLLEDQLALPLFVRSTTLTLTAAGARYLEVVQAAFAALVTGTEAMRASAGQPVVRIACVQALASSWLVPRLDVLMSTHPEIEIQIITGDSLVDIASGEADLAIRFGQGTWAGLESERLLALDAFPVCAPSLRRSLKTPRDLLDRPWIHLTSYPRAFRDWLAAAGLADSTSQRNLSFDNAELVFRAAERGLGVAMATSVLVQPYLDAKRLVRPFELATPVAGSYFLVDRPDDRRVPSVAAVRSFLLEIARTTNASQSIEGRRSPSGRPRKSGDHS